MSMLDALWHITQTLAPWLLVGMVVAGVVHVFIPEDFFNLLNQKGF